MELHCKDFRILSYSFKLSVLGEGKKVKDHFRSPQIFIFINYLGGSINSSSFIPIGHVVIFRAQLCF